MKAGTLALTSLLLLAGCATSTTKPADTSQGVTDADDLSCTCGEPSSRLNGCPFPACAQGYGNYANVNCVCAGLAVHADSRSVSDGAASRLVGQDQILTLASGRQAMGNLVSDDGQKIVLKSSGGQRTLAYSELAPQSVYRLKKGRASKDDGPAQIKVGNYARDVGYYAHAKRHYAEALAADSSLEPQVDEETAKLRDMASKQELKLAGEALAAGKTADAEKHLSNILTQFPDELAAGEATAMLGQIDAREASSSRSVEDTSAEIAEKLEPATKRVEKAKKENRDGLLASSKLSKASRHFEKAVDEGEKARKDIDKLIEKNKDDEPLVRAAQALDQDAVEVMIDADMNAASIYMTRESYNDALGHVNHAIALDSKNQAARSMRARIEMAAADDGDIGIVGWRVRGRGLR